MTLIIRTYLASQSLDHLSTAIRKGGIKDLADFFPPSKRDPKTVQAHFREAGLPQVADWYTKKQDAVVKGSIVKTLQEMCEAEDPTDEVRVDKSWCMVCKNVDHVEKDNRVYQRQPGGTASGRRGPHTNHLAGLNGIYRLER